MPTLVLSQPPQFEGRCFCSLRWQPFQRSKVGSMARWEQVAGVNVITEFEWLVNYD